MNTLHDIDTVYLVMLPNKFRQPMIELIQTPLRMGAINKTCLRLDKLNLRVVNDIRQHCILSIITTPPDDLCDKVEGKRRLHTKAMRAWRPHNRSKKSTKTINDIITAHLKITFNIILYTIHYPLHTIHYSLYIKKASGI